MKKDIVTKSIIKNLARDISIYLLDIDPGIDFELIDKESERIEKREADILYKTDDIVVHIEIQNNNQTILPIRMLRYYSDIKFTYHSLPIKQFVIYIGKEKCTINEIIEDESLTYRYKLIDMHKVDCEKFLYSDDIAAVALSILCDFKDKDSQLVVNTILKRLKELSRGDSYLFRNYLKSVEILSENRDLQKELKEGEKMLTVDIEKMPSYQLGEEEGIQKGIQKGKEETLKISIQAFKKLGIEDSKIASLLNITMEDIKKLS